MEVMEGLEAAGAMVVVAEVGVGVEEDVMVAMLIDQESEVNFLTFRCTHFFCALKSKYYVVSAFH